MVKSDVHKWQPRIEFHLKIIRYHPCKRLHFNDYQLVVMFPSKQDYQIVFSSLVLRQKLQEPEANRKECLNNVCLPCKVCRALVTFSSIYVPPVQKEDACVAFMKVYIFSIEKDTIEDTHVLKDRQRELKYLFLFF